MTKNNKEESDLLYKDRYLFSKKDLICYVYSGYNRGGIDCFKK